jgi:hypothetical protein
VKSCCGSYSRVLLARRFSYHVPDSCGNTIFLYSTLVGRVLSYGCPNTSVRSRACCGGMMSSCCPSHSMPAHLLHLHTWSSPCHVPGCNTTHLQYTAIYISDKNRRSYPVITLLAGFRTASGHCPGSRTRLCIHRHQCPVLYGAKTAGTIMMAAPSE